MDPNQDPSGEYVIESETNLQAETSTLAGLGPRSLTPSLDLVILLVPVCGDAGSIASFIHAIEAQVEPPFGVMLVYNPGDEATIAVATEFARTRPWLDLIPNAAGQGHVNALRSGFDAIGHGPVVVMNIDGSDDLNDLGRMRRLYAEGHPIVAASRDMHGGHRRAGSRFANSLGRIANRLIRRFGQIPLDDATNSYRLYDASLANELGIETQHDADVAVELAAKATAQGLPIIEIPTTQTESKDRTNPLSAINRFVRRLRYCRRIAKAPSVHLPVSPSARLRSLSDSGLTNAPPSPADD